MTLHQRADLIADRPLHRLSTLQARLRAAGCSVHVDDALGQLHLSLAAEEASWMRTGYLTAVLLAFDDVVHWRPDGWRPRPAPTAVPPRRAGAALS